MFELLGSQVFAAEGMHTLVAPLEHAFAAAAPVHVFPEVHTFSAVEPAQLFAETVDVQAFVPEHSLPAPSPQKFPAVPRQLFPPPCVQTLYSEQIFEYSPQELEGSPLPAQPLVSQTFAEAPEQVFVAPPLHVLVPQVLLPPRHVLSLLPLQVLDVVQVFG